MSNSNPAGYWKDMLTALQALLPGGSASAAVTPVVTAAVATGKVIKASAGNLHAINCWAPVAGFFLVHDSATVPVAGAVTPVKVYQVAAGQGIEVQYDPPLRGANGWSVSF